MGSDDLFKKRREVRKKRDSGFRQPRANSFLIVTEGEKSEPLYLQGIVKQIKKSIGGNVKLMEVPTFEIRGEGCSTCKLVEKTEEIVKKAKVLYQNIWVVFDKDDFQDFDEAIVEGTKKGYQLAWSNQSFEYWAYLHFFYSDSALHRDEWCKKLDAIFSERKLGGGKYQKNAHDLYEQLASSEGLVIAIKHAKRRMSIFKGDQMRPSQFDPGTTMHLLMEDLNKFLEE